jgi:lactoylglutathione lyase
MKIEHIAIWVNDLEHMRSFYQDFFDMTCNEKYHNPKKNFTSYFLSFPTGARIEIMHKPEISALTKASDMSLGFTHFAISVGSIEQVDILTQKAEDGGYQIVGAPRTTGDGYYESVIADPEGNLIEITE